MTFHNWIKIQQHKKEVGDCLHLIEQIAESAKRRKMTNEKLTQNALYLCLCGACLFTYIMWLWFASN